MTIIDQAGASGGGKWLRPIAALGVVWYGFGLLQMGLAVTRDTGAAVAAGIMSQEHAAAVAATPAVIWLAFALASGAGLVGAALLFMRRPAFAAFALSLASALLYYIWVYGLSGTASVLPREELVIGVVVVVVTAGFAALSYRYR